VLSHVTPGLQRIRPGRREGGGGGTSRILTLGDLFGSGAAREAVRDGSAGGGNDDGATLGEKSDHSIVARKPGNAGGAKGVTG
jgi:hypothetical protein